LYGQLFLAVAKNLMQLQVKQLDLLFGFISLIFLYFHFFFHLLFFIYFHMFFVFFIHFAFHEISDQMGVFPMQIGLSSATAGL